MGKLDLTKMAESADKVRSMLEELEGAASLNPQWATRFVTYQKLAPSRDKGESK